MIPESIENFFKCKPYAHQVTAFEKSCNKRNYAFFCEMGTGKSAMLLANIAKLYAEGSINAALIVSVKGSYMNWVYNEIPLHFNREYTLYHWSGDGTQEKREKLKNLNNPSVNRGLVFFVMNTEALSFIKGKTAAINFLQNYKCLFCIDESTSIKTPSSLRTKSALALSKHAIYKRIMTGSPITKNPLDLWAQCAFLDLSLLGHNSFYSFRGSYAVMRTMTLGYRSFQKIVGFRNLESLTKRLEAFSYRVLKTECLDLPEKIYTRRYVELTPEQLKVYRDLKTEAMTQFESGKVATAQIAMTVIMKMHQALCGHVKCDDGTIKHLPNNRIAVLMETLEEIEGKAIIWCNYREDIKLISAALEKQYGRESFCLYYGDTTDEERQKGIEELQDTNSTVRYFVGTTRTGGKGITLTAASTVIYYSQDYDLELRLQSEDRVHRIGQRNACTYIDLVVQKTVDEKILNALREKKNLAASVLDNWRNVIVDE